MKSQQNDQHDWSLNLINETEHWSAIIWPIDPLVASLLGWAAINHCFHYRLIHRLFSQLIV